MSQYQRMISYLYRYEDDVKKNNTGYARIELRGDSCRITVQMRDLLSELPEVAFFRQEPQGMQRITAGRLKRNGNGFGCRIETRTDNMMNSGYSFADLDGLIILVNNFLYFATTWKDVTVQLGYEEILQKDQVTAAGTEARDTAWQDAVMPEREMADRAEQSAAVKTEQGKMGKTEQGSTGGAEKIREKEIEEERQNEAEDEGRLDAGERNRADSEGMEMASVPVKENSGTVSAVRFESVTKPAGSSPGDGELTDTIAACQCDACCRCPQRKRMEDFGRHMLAMFPRMYPFEIESIEECVRLELKDIGCLPVRYWSLSGNPFLLHGYYCYRHILFTRASDGKYYIGVPGIYNRENEKQAKSCGFEEFKTLSEVADRRGAFGYWLFGISNS